MKSCLLYTSAAVRREQADIARFFQRFAEYIPEMGGIAGQAGLGAFPDELIGGIPQLDGTRADIQRHRNCLLYTSRCV